MIKRPNEKLKSYIKNLKIKQKEIKKEIKNINKETPQYFMLLAYLQALKAFYKLEVPVGAVVVKDNKVIAKAYNKRETKQNALFHAEVLTINKACKKLKSFRLNDCQLFVTLEPCPMCSGAIINARLNKVFYACCDFNYGCAGSKYNFLQDKAFEHNVDYEVGLLKDDCQKLLKDFFTLIRENNKDAKKISK